MPVGAGLGQPRSSGSSCAAQAERVLPGLGAGGSAAAGGIGALLARSQRWRRAGQDTGAARWFVPGGPAVPFSATQRLLTWHPGRQG